VWGEQRLVFVLELHDGPGPARSANSGEPRERAVAVDPASVTFDWGDISGATAYEFQLGSPCGVGNVVTHYPSDYTLTGLAPLTTYYWRTRGEIACGVWSSWSACFSFTTSSASPCPGREIPHTCVPATTCYPAALANTQTLPTMSAEQWQTVGQPVHELLQPDRTYSIGFEYRSTAATEIKLGLGNFDPNTSNPGLVIGESALPASADGWKTFWSAPFSVTADQLKNLSVLRLIGPRISNGGIEYRNVRILPYPNGRGPR